MTTARVRWLSTRKMTKQGGALYISIPVEFCKENGIEKGTALDIYTDSTGEMIILKKGNTRFNRKE